MYLQFKNYPNHELKGSNLGGLHSTEALVSLPAASGYISSVPPKNFNEKNLSMLLWLIISTG